MKHNKISISKRIAGIVTTGVLISFILLSSLSQYAVQPQVESQDNEKTTDELSMYSSQPEEQYLFSAEQNSKTLGMSQISSIFSGYYVDIEYDGRYIYATSQNSALKIFDAGDPNNITLIATSTLSYVPSSIHVNDTLVYVVGDDALLHVIDVSNLIEPQEIGDVKLYSTQAEVTVEGKYVYAAAGKSGLIIFEKKSSSDLLIQVGKFNLPLDLFTPYHIAEDVVVNNQIAYTTFSDTGLVIIDVSDPANPVKLGQYSDGNNPTKIFYNNSIVYYLNDNGMEVIGVYTPSSPTYYVSYSNTGISDFTIVGDYGYMLTGFGIQTVFINLYISYFIVVEQNFNAFEGVYSKSNLVLVDNTFVTSGEHDILISEKLNETHIASIATYTDIGFTTSSILDPTGNILYSVTGYGELVTADVSDPSVPKFMSYTNFSFSFYSFTEYHLAERGDLLFLTEKDVGLVTVDVSDPMNPVEKSIFNDGGRAIDVAVWGNYVLVADSGDGLEIVDVSQPQTPVKVGTFNEGKNVTAVSVSNDLAYIIDEEGLKIIDLSTPSSPQKIGEFLSSGTETLTVRGDTVYVVIGGTLYALDTSDPADVKIIDSVQEYAYRLETTSSYIFLSTQGLVKVYNITDPADMSLLTTYTDHGYLSQFAVTENYMFLSQKTNGTLIVAFDEVIAPRVIARWFEPMNPIENRYGTVYTRASDLSGISSVELHYMVDGSVWRTMTMTPRGGDLYSTEIGPFKLGQRVEYYVTATDSSLWSNTTSSLEQGLDVFTVRSYDTSPPEITFVTINPDPPGEGQAVTVSANITDLMGIASAEVIYRVNGLKWTNVPMTSDEEAGRYIAELGKFQAGVQVDFYIKAVDSSLHNNTGYGLSNGNYFSFRVLGEDVTTSETTSESSAPLKTETSSSTTEEKSSASSALPVGAGIFETYLLIAGVFVTIAILRKRSI